MALNFLKLSCGLSFVMCYKTRMEKNMYICIYFSFSLNTSFSIHSSVVLVKLLSISQSMFPNILVPGRSLLPLREVWERVGVIAHGRVQVPVVQKKDNAIHQGPVTRSLVSANRWLRGIKMYRFPWYLTLVSTNHASSNPGQINLYPMDNAIGFPNTNPLDSDLSGG